ncbi:MAG: DUF1294 domain-containing protein [Chloroflexi bacterium]|nr:DUF1294 domain-containing protein [Chloroflexota bacterium]
MQSVICLFGSALSRLGRSHGSAQVRFSLFTFGTAIALAVVVGGLFAGVDALWSWIFAITVITFLAFGYDKAISGTGATRVPEAVLLALTFFGGTVGALVGRPVFHHKTKKVGFRVKFWFVVVIQIALAASYFLWARASSGG